MSLFSYLKKVYDLRSQKSYLTWFVHNNGLNRQTWRGVPIMKFPPDLFNYQEIIHERGIRLVIECGAFKGGSTLFFSDMLGNAGMVLSIDNCSQKDSGWDSRVNRPNIIMVSADALSEEARIVMKDQLSKANGPAFMILDDWHSGDHIERELEAFTPLLRKGDYLVIEDTVNRDALDAVKRFMKDNPTLYTHDDSREKKYGGTVAIFGYWIRN